MENICKYVFNPLFDSLAADIERLFREVHCINDNIADLRRCVQPPIIKQSWSRPITPELLTPPLLDLTRPPTRTHAAKSASYADICRQQFRPSVQSEWTEVHSSRRTTQTGQTARNILQNFDTNFELSLNNSFLPLLNVLEANNAKSKKDIITSNHTPIHTKAAANKLTFKEIDLHVLDAPVGYARVHAVDETFRMGAGIAVDFDREYGQKDLLLQQKKKVGEVAILTSEKGDKILYMVAKKRHFFKPTPRYENLFKKNYIQALHGLRETCERLKITKLAMPQMGCYSDRLSWSEFMKPALLNIFGPLAMEILVCRSSPRTVRRVPKQPDAGKLLNRKLTMDVVDKTNTVTQRKQRKSLSSVHNGQSRLENIPVEAVVTVIAPMRDQPTPPPCITVDDDNITLDPDYVSSPPSETKLQQKNIMTSTTNVTKIHNTKKRNSSDMNKNTTLINNTSLVEPSRVLRSQTARKAQAATDHNILSENNKKLFDELWSKASTVELPPDLDSSISSDCSMESCCSDDANRTSFCHQNVNHIKV
jgi:hypothetical protein